MFLAGIVMEFSEGTKNVEQFYQSASVWAVLCSFLAAGTALLFMTRFLAPDSITDGSPSGIGWTLGTLSYLTAGILLGAVLGCGILAVGWYVYPPEADPSRNVLGDMAHTSGISRFIWACLLLILIPPFEEFLYRGVLYAGISNSSNAIIAGIVVTALFVLGHLPHTLHYVPGIFGFTILGILALMLRIQSRSLGPAVALHATYNLCIVVGIYFFFPVP